MPLGTKNCPAGFPFSSNPVHTETPILSAFMTNPVDVTSRALCSSAAVDSRFHDASPQVMITISGFVFFFIIELLHN